MHLFDEPEALIVDLDSFDYAVFINRDNLVLLEVGNIDNERFITEFYFKIHQMQSSQWAKHFCIIAMQKFLVPALEMDREVFHIQDVRKYAQLWVSPKEIKADDETE